MDIMDLQVIVRSLDEARLGVNARSGAANSPCLQIASFNGAVSNFNNKFS